MQGATTINNRYVISGPLGGGGMAQVFLARDEVLERDVALKVLREQYAENEEFVERFRREALSVASLSHPNIVQVYDRGSSEDGRYYIAMEYVPGGTLYGRIVRDGPFSPRTAAAVAVQVADALGAAHERGLIHRDVKPQNVLVSASGDAKVADFGIARAAAADVISRTSAVLGTAKYMSPEQAMGREVGPPGDLYSLGVVLYEMLTGEVPFEADSPVAISMKHVNKPPRPPREIREEIPEEMNAVVLKLLAKDPGARHSSAASLVADLDRVANGLAPVGGMGGDALTEPSRAVPGAAPGRYRRRRGPVRGAAALAFLTLLGGLGWGLLAGPNLGEIVGSLEGIPDRARAEAEELRSAVFPSDVTVPDVEDLDEEAARQRLDEAGLGTATRDRRSEAEDAGQVLEQSVPAGKKVEEGSRILLAISSGPVVQQGSTPDPVPDDGTEDPDAAGGSGDPPKPADPEGSGFGADAAIPGPDPGVEQEADEVPPVPSSSEPSSGQAPASVPPSPESAAPSPSSPSPSSPAPSSLGPSSPAPSPPDPPLPAPPSPDEASPDPAPPDTASPAPSSPDPVSPAPSSPDPASPAPSSPDPASSASASPGPRDSSAPPVSSEPSSAEASTAGSPPADDAEPEDGAS